MRGQTSRRPAGGIPRLLLLGLCSALLAGWVLAHSPAVAQTTQANPALSRLEIDVWPEFDQPSKVLVILRAEIAADATLPATVSLRIPAASGGPSAVATAVSANSQLLTLNYQTVDVQVDFMTITFSAPNRFVHVEFYDPVATDTAERTYRYLWTGDFSVAQTVVQLQEPAGSSEVSVSPDLGAPTTQADGLSYREADLGALEAGKSLAVEVGYSKAEARTSADILGLVQPTPPAAAEDDSIWTSDTTLILAGAGVIAAAVAMGAFVIWRRMAAAAATGPVSRVQRRRATAAKAGPYCSHCGTALAEDARFCDSCGHRVKGKG